MTTSTPTPTPPPSSTTKLIRKLIIEVIGARNLLPKDGHGSSSPFVEIDFDGERKRSRTIHSNLNPSWYEEIEFLVMDIQNMEYTILEIEVFTDNTNKKKQFLGRVKICGTQFKRKGEGGIIYFQLEKKNVFQSVRGEIGLRIYYLDEEISDEAPAAGVTEDNSKKEEAEIKRVDDDQEKAQLEIPQPTETAQEAAASSCLAGDDDSSFVRPQQIHERTEEIMMNCSVPMDPPLQEVRKMQATGTTERVRYFQRPSTNHGMDYQPRVIPGRFTGETEQTSTATPPAYDLVEPMQYLFVRIVKGCNISVNDNPYVKIVSGNHRLKSRPALIRQPSEQQGGSEVLEWNQTFALSQNKQALVNAPTLEVSICDGKTNQFLGGVCLDLSEVPVRRDPRQTDFAPEWYSLEGGSNGDEQERITGKIQLAVWVGTQADSAFPMSFTSESPFIDYTKSKVYQSPRLWYLRVTIIETSHDLQIHAPPHSSPDIRVKAQLGFQFVRTRRGSTNNQHSSSFFWNEDLIFVSKDPNPSEPSSDEQLKFYVEGRLGKDTVLLGEVSVPLSSIGPPRIDDRPIPSRWLSLRSGGDADNGGSYSGRIHVRLCFEGGYHVLDEAAHVCSDFQPTAKQLCKPPVGMLELGIRGARGLLPMKTRNGGKGSTDSYCVAKYGKRWCRTKTIVDSFDPRWNEQYTWEVYDPCTVLTIGVFDNWRMYGDTADTPDCRIGKIRIRVSTLESNKVYTSSYPLLVLLRSGLKKMGEIEIAIRFACPHFLPETCSVYGKPMLPKLHYLRPIGLGQQEALRSAATKMVAKHVANAEPPLNPEVVRYILDADSHTWSMRKSKANWFRILSVLSWAIGFWNWVDDIRRWRNPVTTFLVHFLYLVLVWYPEMIVPTGALYLFLIGVWSYRFKPKIPAGMDIRLSQAERLDPDELEEELDTYPSSCPNEVLRMRYDRLRTLAGRVQKVLGDFAAQGERVQALLSWRDPRATRLFIGVLLIVAVTLYVVPPKMVAVALGFYSLRHPMFRDPMPPASLNFFRRLPSLSDRLI